MKTERGIYNAPKQSNTMKKPTKKEIARIIHGHFTPSPEIRAAQELFSLGVREKDFSLKEIGSQAPYFPGHPWVLSVINALRDLERKITRP